MVIRATTSFNLQCNNVARQVERKCCPHCLAFRSDSDCHKNTANTSHCLVDNDSNGTDFKYSYSPDKHVVGNIIQMSSVLEPWACSTISGEKSLSFVPNKLGLTN